ncbi:hypothetical protein LTR17_010985 [Elasticomyces elasticus]|nr:hypothetical protein LTR17_010985 [Elasticomyces elasticus]
MAGAFLSERLIFRAVEVDDEPFLGELLGDSENFAQSAPVLMIPPGSKGAKEGRERLENAVMGAIVCLQQPSGQSGKPVPIGLILMNGDPPPLAHHRRIEMGISLARSQQGKGYGSETIRFALRWAFQHANYHKVSLAVFEHNPHAARLYEKLGFVLEGRRREHVWREGRYWDQMDMSILDREWRERYGNDKISAQGGANGIEK